MRELLTSKTFWTAAGTVVTTAGMAACHVIPWGEAIPAIGLALSQIFQRHATAKQNANS